MRKLALLLTMLCAVVGLGLYATSSGFSSPWAPTKVATPTAGEGDEASAFVPLPDRWYRLSVAGNDGRTGRVWEVYRTTGYESFLTDQERTNSKAAEGTNRLLTNASQAKPNDWQLFKFIKGSGDNAGKYAILSKATGKYLSDDGKSGGLSGRFDFKSDKPRYAFYLHTNAISADGKYQSRIYMTDPAAGGTPLMLNGSQGGQGYAINCYNSKDGDNGQLFTFTEVIEQTYLRPSLEFTTSSHASSECVKTAIRPVKITFAGDNDPVDWYTGETIGALAVRANKMAKFTPEDGYYISKLTLDVTRGHDNNAATTIAIAGGTAQAVSGDYNRDNIATYEFVNSDPNKEITVAAASGLVALWRIQVQLTKKPGVESITFPLTATQVDQDAAKFAAGTKWYRMYLRNDTTKFVRYDNGAFSYVQQTPNGGVIPGDLWCFEPTEKGARFYNFGEGAEKVVTGTKTTISMGPVKESTDEEWTDWTFYVENNDIDGGVFFVRATAEHEGTHLFWHDINNHFGYWNNSDAKKDDGSRIRFIEVDENGQPVLSEPTYPVVVTEEEVSTHTESNDRYTTSVSLTSSAGEQSIDDLQTGPRQKIYWNYADIDEPRVFTASPGDQVTLKMDFKGRAMHKIVYIDWDKDGFTGSAHTSFVGKPDGISKSANGDMVAGINVGQLNGQIPDYTIPDNIALGRYRIRFKIDWDGNGDGVNATTMPAGNPGAANGSNRISANGGIIVDAWLDIVEKATEEFDPDEEKWYRLTVLGSDGRRGRSLEAYHVDMEPTPVAAANARAGRLLTNDPTSPFNDYQLFRFEEDEATGRYAIYNKGVRAYLNPGDLSDAGPARFDFTSASPVYAFYITGTTECGDHQKAAQIHLTNPTGSDHKFLNCGAAGQGFAINFFTEAANASDAHRFIFTEMEDNRVADVTFVREFPEANFDSGTTGYRNGVTTPITSTAPIRIRLAANTAVGWSSKDRKIVQLKENSEISIEPVSAPAGYYVSKVILNVSSADGNASTVSLNGNDEVSIPGGNGSGSTIVAATASSADQIWKISVGSKSILIWEMTVEFSRPFSADNRKAQTAERLRKLGNLTALGFEKDEAERRAAEVEAYEFAPDATADDVIDWCAQQFINYVKTADYGDESAYFHINNKNYTGSLAVDRAGDADLFDPMSAYALWCFYPDAASGTIKLYNPMSGKWLAVEGASVTVVENQTDATPLYIGGSAGENNCIFTTSASDINNAVVASSATTLGMAAATTNLSGPDHWGLQALTDADCKEVLDVTREIILDDLNVYEKVPALWSSESLEQVRQEIEQVQLPSDLSLANLFSEGQGWNAYEAELEQVMAGIKEKCLGISFYLTQKTKTDAAPLRIMSVNGANNIVRVAALDKTCIFTIDEVNKDGEVKIAYTNEAGVKKYIARSGNAYVANDQGSWFEIVVSPRNSINAVYGTNEVALLDPQGGYINRTSGVAAFTLGSWSDDDDGSRWIVTAMNAAQAAADIEAEREAAIAKLEQLREVPFFWPAEEMNTAIEEVKAVTVSTAGLSPEAALAAVLDARDTFEQIIIKARLTTAGIKFAAYNGNASTGGYLSSRQDGVDGTGFFLTQQTEITGPTAEWVLTVADETVPSFYISGPDADGGTCYIKARPGGNNQSWLLTNDEAEAGQFKVITVGSTGKVAFMSYPTDDETRSYIHNAQWNGKTNDLVRWDSNAEMSQWTIMGLDAEALQSQLDNDIAAAKGQLDQMRRLPAIWPAVLVDEAETQITDFTIDPESEVSALNQYVDYRQEIDKIITDVNSQVDNCILYFTNVANQGLLSVGDAHGNNTERLYRQNDPVRSNGNFFKLIPDGTGFKLFNEHFGRYIAGNPGADNRQWSTVADESQAATIYFDATFCSGTNETGLSTSATAGASGNYFIHANAGDPVRWNGNNNPSRWIVASATQADIDAAKYIAWLEDSKTASPWGAYSLSEGVKAIKAAISAGNATPEEIEGLYNGTIETVEQTIASVGQDAEVIISHHPSGHILVASGEQLHKRQDNRQGAALSNNTFEPAWRWKLVAKDDSPNKFHIMSMAIGEDETPSYVHHFETGENNVMGAMTTTEDEKLAAVITLKEGRLVFENRDDEPQLRTLAEGDDEEAAEPEHEYWVIGLYQPNTLMPQTSTAEAPKLYYIRNVAKMRETEAKRQRQYLTAGGAQNGSALQLYKDPQAASLWYVTEDGDGTYKIRNAYYTDVMIQSPNKVSNDPLNAATSLYIQECTHVQAAQGVGLYISTQKNLAVQNSTCLDRGGFDDKAGVQFDGLSGGYSPRNGDYLGTAWVFTPVTENDEVAFFEQSKENHYNANMDMIEYFRMANPWCWDVFDRAAGEVSATFSPSGSFGDALKELDDLKALDDMIADFSAALTEELAGKTFIMHSLARRLNIPLVTTARIGVNSSGIVAAKDGATDQNDAFTFMPSEKDGYFYIYNGEGKFIGASGTRHMVDNIDDAGRFTLELKLNKNGAAGTYWTCIKQDNGQYLSMSGSGAGLMGTAGNNNETATGFEFEIYYPAPSGIEDVITDASVLAPALTGDAQLYDLRGARINPANAAPGIYILRSGSEAVKIRIR